MRKTKKKSVFIAWKIKLGLKPGKFHDQGQVYVSQRK